MPNSFDFDFNTIANKQWSCAQRGLRKELIDFSFSSMEKATEISRCLIHIKDVRNLGERETNYLNKENEGKEFWIELGNSLTPIDVYLETFLQQMLAGERSRCYIKCKSEDEISFTLELCKIDFINNIYKLSVKEMYELALKLKENGVKMFKKYPLFAHEYFCRASKCLISFKPFDGFSEQVDKINTKDFEKLYENLKLNIAACLIKEKRFDDVLYLTEFIEESIPLEVQEKGLYRRVLAFYNLKRYEEAKKLIEKSIYKDHKEFSSLYAKILMDSKTENEKYCSMVKKMFN